MNKSKVTIFEAVDKVTIDSLKNALTNLDSKLGQGSDDAKVIVKRIILNNYLPKILVANVRYKRNQPLFDICHVYIMNESLRYKIRRKSSCKWFPDNWRPLTQSSLLGAYSFRVPKLTNNKIN